MLLITALLSPNKRWNLLFQLKDCSGDAAAKIFKTVLPLNMARTQSPQVMATSRGGYAAEAARIGVHFCGDPDDFCEEHPDVVVLATSITSTEAVLKSLPLTRLKRSTLFVDVLSVKEFPKKLFLSLLPPEVSNAPVMLDSRVLCLPNAASRAEKRISGGYDDAVLYFTEPTMIP